MASLFREPADDGPTHGRASTVLEGRGREQAGYGPELQIRDRARLDQARILRITPSARSVPVHYDRQHNDTHDSMARGNETDARCDEVWDCSEQTAHERLERTHEGNEPGRTGITLEDWRNYRGMTAYDNRTSGTQGEHYGARAGASHGNMMGTNNEYEGGHIIWEKGHWTQSSGNKRRVHIPEEHRGAKRYAKNNGKETRTDHI